MPAIAAWLPEDAVKAVVACLDFCYLVRRSVIDISAMQKIEDALARLHKHREFYITAGVRKDISLPRQHALVHYTRMIQLFGVPTGIGTSITESKHKQVVKGTYVRTNKFKPLMQMLVLNSRMDKLSAARADFARRGMLDLPTQLLGFPAEADLNFELNAEGEDDMEGEDSGEDSDEEISPQPENNQTQPDEGGIRDDFDLLDSRDFDDLRCNPNHDHDDPEAGISDSDDDSNGNLNGNGRPPPTLPSSTAFLGYSPCELSVSAGNFNLSADDG